MNTPWCWHLIMAIVVVLQTLTDEIMLLIADQTYIADSYSVLFPHILAVGDNDLFGGWFHCNLRERTPQ